MPQFSKDLVAFCDNNKIPGTPEFPFRCVKPVSMDEIVYITLWYLAIVMWIFLLSQFQLLTDIASNF